LAKAVGILNPLHHAVTLWDAQQSFKATDEAYQLMKPNAPMMRIDFLCDQANDEKLPAIAHKCAKESLHTK
jgi:hypothetical protein